MKKVLLVLSFSLLIVGLFTESILAKELILWDILVDAQVEKVVLEDAISRFEADNPEYTIKHVPISNDNYKTKLKVAMGANSEPDIFMTWGGGPLAAYINAGKVLDITDELIKDDWISRFVPAGLDIVTFDDRIYGIPVTGMESVLVWYRTDIFDKLGLEIPKTYSEFKDVVKVLKENGYIPIALANKNRWTGSFFYMYVADRLGGKEAFVNAALRKGGSFNDESFIRAGEVVQELVDLGAFPPGVNGLDEDQGQSRQLLYANKAVMYVMGTWAYDRIEKENPGMSENLDFFPFPVFEDGKGDPSNLIGSPAGYTYHVAASSPHKEAAVEFLRYLSDEKASKYLVEVGNLPPFNDIGQYLTDPMNKKVYKTIQKANYVQLYYDQYLPPQVAEAHLDTMQGLFGKTLTPEEAANKFEEAAQKYLDN